MMIEDKISKQAGIGELINLGKNALNCCGVHASRNEKGRSCLYAIGVFKVNLKSMLLLTASLLATELFITTFSVAYLIAMVNHINDHDTNQIFQDIRDSTLTLPLILFNSAVFVASLAIDISILRSFPMKPWPQITVSMIFFSYMSLIMKILPWASMVVLVFSVPLLVLAAAGKLFKFDE